MTFPIFGSEDRSTQMPRSQDRRRIGPSRRLTPGRRLGRSRGLLAKQRVDGLLQRID